MDKDLVKNLYAAGLNSKEIADQIKLNRETVKKCIQRNFKDIKELHMKNRKHYKFHVKEVEKAVNYESKKFISDKSFVLKNRSIYRTKENGDITLKNKKDLECAIPWDVPRRLSNELSC